MNRRQDTPGDALASVLERAVLLREARKNICLACLHEIAHELDNTPVDVERIKRVLDLAIKITSEKK